MGGGAEFRARMLSWSRSEPLTVSKAKPAAASPGVAKLVISSPFGWRSDPIRGGRRIHGGVDLPGPSGTRIYATGAGTVTFAGWMNGYGNLVQIDHPGGVRTRYGHLSRIGVSSGTRVGQGELIGRMGSTGRSTGSHLHYEVRARGVAVDPMDYIGQSAPAIYETEWGPEIPVVARWTGWKTGQNASSLPAASIP